MLLTSLGDTSNTGPRKHLSRRDTEAPPPLRREAMDIHSENLYMIGVVGYGAWPAVKSNRMRNVPDEVYSMGWNVSFTKPETYWMAE